MKLPSFSLGFFKKPTKKKRTITTFGKRGSNASSSSHKTRRSSSNRKTRKRSITYYAPSKSKFYPTEHFPTLQRVARQATAVSATPLVYPSEQRIAVSTDIDSKLNSYQTTNGTATHRSHTAKQTYLCDNDYGDIVLHQPPAWYMQSKPHQNYHQTETIASDLLGPNNNCIQNKLYSHAPIDANGNVLYDDNCLSNSYGRSTYSKECVQGVPIPLTVKSIPLNDSNIKYGPVGIHNLHRQSQHNLLPSNVTTAYNNTVFSSINNSTNAKCLPNNINNSCSVSQLASFSAPIFNASFPFKKKSDRHRRRKVRSKQI